MARQGSIDRPAGTPWASIDEEPRPKRRVSRGQSVRDIMTPEPATLEATATVMHAAELMREQDIGDVVVLEDDRLYGILTDRDIVVRVLAERNDPAAVTVGEVCSREKAIRRLPVVEDDGVVVGIVSLGDLAAARDRKSALGDISTAAPNT